METTLQNQSCSNQLSFQKLFIVVFLPFAFAFILSCLFRTMNAVLAPTLIQLTQVQPAQLGLLNAIYFLAYALFQIPLGTFLDKYGAKRTQSALFIIGGIGLILSGLTSTVWIIACGHALLGIGMSGGLMAAFKLIVQWFPREKIPMLNGIMMTFGGIGILLSATPTAWLVTHVGWETLNLSFGILTILTAILIFFVVPEVNTATQKISLVNQIRGLSGIYQSRFFWKISSITASVLASFMAIHGLWIENWLQTVSHVNQHTIDNYLLLIGIAMTISLLATGYVAKIAKYYNQSLENILGYLLVIYIVIEISIILWHGSGAWVFWVLLSLVSQIFNLSYAVLTQHFQKTHSGRANTALNVVVFSSVFFIQYIIGITVSLLEKTHTAMHSYQISFLIPIVLQVICIVGFCLPSKKQRQACQTS